MRLIEGSGWGRRSPDRMRNNVLFEDDSDDIVSYILFFLVSTVTTVHIR